MKHGTYIYAHRYKSIYMSCMKLSTNTYIYISQGELDKQQLVLSRKMDEARSNRIRLQTLLQKKEKVVGVKAATAAKVCMCMGIGVYMH